jgi:hypothetical protein
MKAKTTFSEEWNHSVRVTRKVCEKIAQNGAQHIFGQNKYITFNEEKKLPKKG